MAQEFTRLGLIPSTTSVPALVHTLNVTFRAEGFQAPADAMARLGVPANGSALIEQRLRALLRRDTVEV